MDRSIQCFVTCSLLAGLMSELTLVAVINKQIAGDQLESVCGRQGDRLQETTRAMGP